MGFVDFLFRYPSFKILILALFFTIHCFHLVESQKSPVNPQSPPPPPPPPASPPPPPPPSPSPPPPPPPPPVNGTTNTVRVAPQPSPVSEVTEPLSSPPLLLPPPRNPPRRLPPPPRLPPPSRPPPPPRPREKSKRDGLNKGEMVGVVFVGLIAMLQVIVAVFLVFKRKQLLNFEDTN